MKKTEIEAEIKKCQEIITYIAMGDRWSNEDYKVFDEMHTKLRELNNLINTNQYEE